MRRSASIAGGPPAKKKAFSGGGWQAGLLATMNDPSQVVQEDERVVIIKDKYPKARHHFLVLPRSDIPTLSALRQEHVGLLEHMLDLGRRITGEYGDTKSFRFGYHAVPSMNRIHMHVISQDFDSMHLKTKKHWNSFTSSFFRDAQEIVDELKSQGSVTINKALYEGELKEELKCHKCSATFPNIPKLKAHLPKHW